MTWLTLHSMLVPMPRLFLVVVSLVLLNVVLWAEIEARQ